MSGIISFSFLSNSCAAVSSSTINISTGRTKGMSEILSLLNVMLIMGIKKIMWTKIDISEYEKFFFL